jgi:hypothetical protein
MFVLYQQESAFYHFLNYRLNNSWQDNNWDELALPVLLMFKAIKLYFKNQ